MRNAFRVLVRDLGRLGRTRTSWAILAGILIMPSLYAWVNIVAFWNPYGNTQHVNVAVVNLDRGADSDLTGRIDVGDQVVAQLKRNHDLGWQFVGRNEAMDAVRSGSSYAAIVIPRDFSAQLLSLTTGDATLPKVEYYVNEKANAIAPKITDVGASTLETQINSSFVSTVTKTVTQELRSAGDDAGATLLTAKNSTLSALDQTAAEVASARQGIADIGSGLSDTGEVLANAQAALGTVGDTIGNVKTAVAEAQSLASDVRTQISEMTESVTNAYVTGSAQLAEAAAQLNGMIAQLSSAAQQANVEIGSATEDATAVVTACTQALTALQDLQAQLDPSDPAYAAVGAAIDQLESHIAADQTVLADLGQLHTTASATIADVLSSANAINTALRDSAASASAVRQALTGSIPEIDRALADMSTAAGAFSSGLDAVDTLVGQSVNLLSGFDGQLTSMRTALTSLTGNLDGVQSGLVALRTDVNAVAGADIWKTIQATSGLNPQQIADFMATPVQVAQNTVFPVKTYGSAMAPLFVNLSLWIAAFMLVVLLKQEPDTEGIDDLTVRQAYLGRFLLLATFNVVQALVVSVGVALIGVQLTSPGVFIATSVLVGLVYVAIIYALAVSFGYIGKGIAVLLVIMQIPGASGIYPIQMMPPFFQALYPLFPFTYGIAAMRETIGGFYDGAYLRAIRVLLLFAALAFVLGIVVRQRLGDYARLVNTQLARTQLFVTEDVQVLGSRRRLGVLVSVLANRPAMRMRTHRRSLWLHHNHLTISRIVVLAGVALTAVLGCVGWVVPDAKATVLGLWALVCLLVIGTLIALEYARHTTDFAREAVSIPRAELNERIAYEESASHSSMPLGELEAHTTLNGTAGRE